MTKLKKIKYLGVVFAMMSFASVLLAQNRSGAEQPQVLQNFNGPLKVKTAKVDSRYKVFSVRKTQQQFAITFRAEVKSAHYQELILVLATPSSLLKPGTLVHLVAEVVATDTPRTLIRQAVCYFTSPEGEVPVFFETNPQQNVGDFKVNKYLHMHNPQSDYLIL